MSKKGKKSKGKTLNLQDFLCENGAAPASSIVTKSLSWANECEDDDYSPPKILTYAIPTAPRSQRVLDDSTIPTSPPFSAHISNLPYDLNESDIIEYFESVTSSEVLSVRLPREDGDTGRMRGFGYIEFADRDGLIAAVSQPELTLRNRKIRIDISTEQDQKRGGGNRRYDNFGASENRDWRGSRGGGGGQDSNDSRPRSNAENGGNWRSGDRPKMDSPPPARRGYGRRNNDYDDRHRRDDDRAAPLEERPRIKLNPRILPLPELQIDERERETPKPEVVKPRPKPVPSAAIFGNAKPVDTAAKDREIEERLEKERLERERLLKEAELAEKEKADSKSEPEKKEPDDSDSQTTQENGNAEHHNNNDDDNNDETNGATAEKPSSAEVISWRRKPDEDASNGDDQERRTQSPTRKRYSPDRRRRNNDDRRGSRDHNRRDNYNNRDKRDFNRDYQRNDRDRDRNYNREKPERNQNRNYNNRGAPPPQHRDDRDNKPRRAPLNPDEVENRMPKYKPDAKPKLQMSNTYDIFNDEANSD